jgi:hypothetical protein
MQHGHHSCDYFVGVVWLDDVIICAVARCPDLVRSIAEGGHHDHRSVADAANGGEGLCAAEFRRHHIEQHQIWLPSGVHFHAAWSVFGNGDLEAILRNYASGVLALAPSFSITTTRLQS